MLAKNIDVQRGLVNGARGVVKEFESAKGGLKITAVSFIFYFFSPLGYPVIQFTSGLCLPVCPERWSVRTSGGVVVTRKQLPLKLAWAISIHKSQVGAEAAKEVTYMYYVTMEIQALLCLYFVITAI